MKDFLKGLLAFPFVLIGGFAIYWVGAIFFAIVGGIIGFVVVLTPYVLRFVGIVLIVVLAIWGLGKLVTCAQQKKFGVYYYRCENDIMLSLFDGEIMSSNESE